MRILTLLLGTLLAWGALSCQEDKTEPAFDADALRDCYVRGNADSLTVARALVGKWDWVHAKCDFGPAAGSDTLYQGLQVEFREDGTLTVYQAGQPVQRVDWQLKNYGGMPQVYGLGIDNPVMQLHGLVYVCGDQVVFSNKPLDGCDNFYRRGR